MSDVSRVARSPVEETGLGMSAADFDALLSYVETGLGLPQKFFRSLLQEDDWSFVIKTHALLEAAATYLLSSTLDHRLAEPLAQLELSDARTGKLAFAAALDLLDSHHRGFLRRSSELRNKLVHDVKNVDFTFTAHIGQLDSNQRKEFRKFCSYFVEYYPEHRREDERDKTMKNPKFSIWWGALMFVGHVYTISIQAERGRAAAQLDTRKAQILDDFLAKSEAFQADNGDPPSDT